MSESNDSTRRTSSGLIALIPKNQVASPTGQHVQRPRFLPVERDPFKFYLQNRLEPSRILRNSSGEHFRTFQSSQKKRNTRSPAQAFQFPNTSGTFKLYPGTLRSFCNIALQSLKIRPVVAILKKPPTWQQLHGPWLQCQPWIHFLWPELSIVSWWGEL